jgi:hypothetical protein
MNGAMKTLTEELTAWRQTLETMRGKHLPEVDAVIARIDASIEPVDVARAADRIDSA